jgi:hypothetical protein
VVHADLRVLMVVMQSTGVGLLVTSGPAILVPVFEEPPAIASRPEPSSRDT